MDALDHQRTKSNPKPHPGPIRIRRKNYTKFKNQIMNTQNLKKNINTHKSKP